MDLLFTALTDVKLFVRGLGWKELIDITVVAFLFYQVLKLVRGTRATQLLVGVLVVVVISVVAIVFDLQLLAFIVRNAAPFVAVGLIVLFQPELRRALDRVGRFGNLSRSIYTFNLNPQAVIQAVNQVVEACERMSSRRIGALIAFEREVGLSDIAANGVRLGAQVTSELIEAIFFPKSPLHDGAMIVRNAEVLAAGVTLPLPEDGDSVARMGTRHRAALGLSMLSDAKVVVVSEETGAISLAEGGRIERNLTPEALRERLLGERGPGSAGGLLTRRQRRRHLAMATQGATAESAPGTVQKTG